MASTAIDRLEKVFSSSLPKQESIGTASRCSWNSNCQSIRFWEPIPSERFIPDLLPESTSILPNQNETFVAYDVASEPRYTFRVVGHHVGDRSYWINGLHEGEPICLNREPSNEYDPNAVAVHDSEGRQLDT